MRLLGRLQHGVYNQVEGANEEDLQRHYGVDGPERVRGVRQTGAGHPAEEEGENEWEDEDDESGNGARDPDLDSLYSFADSESSSASLAPSLARNIHRDILPNVRHDPIPVARHQDPFADQPDNTLETTFFEFLNKSLSDTLKIPSGYGLRANEWEDETYPEAEFLQVGARRTALTIELPYDVWYPRAVAWGKGLDLLNTMLASGLI